MLVAQIFAGYSLVQVLIFLIVVGAAVAITAVILKQMGVAIPPFVVTIFWILVAVFVGIAALAFLTRIAGSF